MNKKILVLMAISLFLVPLVLATEAYIKPGKMIIYADNHPGENTATYDITVKNNNNKPYIITISVSSGLENYVTLQEEEFTLPANSNEYDVSFDVDISTPLVLRGNIAATYTPEDGVGFVQGISADITVYPFGTYQPPVNYVNCGVDPGFQDGCHQGKYRNYYCESGPDNHCKFEDCVYNPVTEYCTAACCQQWKGENAYCDQSDECIFDGNNPPTIDDYEPIDLTVQIGENDTVLFNHTSSDPNGDALTYIWLENGDEKSSLQNWIYSPNSTGTKNITLVVSDGEFQDTQEWSVSVQSNSVTTTTTTSTTTTTQEDSSSSSGSSGSSWGGSGSSKTTDFYDFESFIQIEAGKEVITQGTFYSKYKSDQKDVEFKISDISKDWYTVSPSKVEKIAYEEKVDIKITFNVPQNIASGDYPFKISTKIGTITYEKKMTLVVTASQTTTTISETATTTTIENTINFDGEDKKESKITGFFSKAGDAAKKFWYIPLITAVLFFGWKFSGMSFERKEKYFPQERVFESSEPTKENNYIELRQTKPKVQVKEIKPEPEVVKKTDESLEKSRQKVIDEIRRKAMEQDKRNM